MFTLCVQDCIKYIIIIDYTSRLMVETGVQGYNNSIVIYDML